MPEAAVEISSNRKKDKRVLVLFLFGLCVLFFDLVPFQDRNDNQKQLLVLNVGAGEGYLSDEALSSRQAFFLNRPMSINSATRQELALIPGIGLQLAGRIVHFREGNGHVATMKDLQQVPGIGVKVSRKISPYITFALSDQ